MMGTPDFDVIKDIPGYKVILKAVLKSQIQQLVEQLATHTEEESIILTASVADGTLSHLGSDSGKSFLDDHEDVKSQFLGFCLKAHHRKKQQEKLEKDKLDAMLSMPTTPSRYAGPRYPYSPRSPRYLSPNQGPRPVAMTRISAVGPMHATRARHEPYPTPRPMKRTMASFNQGSSESPAKNKVDDQIIKVEPDAEVSGQSDSNVNTVNTESSSQPSSPALASTTSSQLKNELSDKEDDVQSESSTSTIPNETLPEGLGLDSDLSNLISGAQASTSSPHTPGDRDSNVNVKLETLSESEMDLEITGVEPGMSIESQDDWSPNVAMGMNYDPAGYAGSQPDLQTTQGYNSGGMFLRCPFCEKQWPDNYKLTRHMRVHTGEKPYQCVVCEKWFSRTDTLKVHMSKHQLIADSSINCQYQP